MKEGIWSFVVLMLGFALMVIIAMSHSGSYPLPTWIGFSGLVIFLVGAYWHFGSLSKKKK